MRNRLVLIAAGVWIASAVICGLGYVETFGPLTVVLLGFVLATDKAAPKNRIEQFIVTIITAGTIWLGLQQHDKRHEQVAYWAHRQVVNCRDADRWEAMSGSAGYPYPRPTEAEARRCYNLDDASDFESALQERGW